MNELFIVVADACRPVLHILSAINVITAITAAQLLVHLVSGCREMPDDDIVPLLVSKIVQCGFYLAPELFEFSGI